MTYTTAQMNEAIAQAIKGERSDRERIQKIIRENEDRMLRVKLMDEVWAEGNNTVTIGRLTVTATTAGNSVREHIRLNFKLGGKRASRAKVEESAQ